MGQFSFDQAKVGGVCVTKGITAGGGGRSTCIVNDGMASVDTNPDDIIWIGDVN